MIVTILLLAAAPMSAAHNPAIPSEEVLGTPRCTQWRMVDGRYTRSCVRERIVSESYTDHEPHFICANSSYSVLRGKQSGCGDMRGDWLKEQGIVK